MSTTDTGAAPRPGGMGPYLEGLIAQATGWARQHDPSFGALRRAGRAAICLPAAFALGIKVIDNPDVAVFCAFGSIAMLLLADFRGSTRDRLKAQATLAIVGAAFVCVGTLASSSEALAAIAMALVGVVVIFAGVISSMLAGATIALLLGFILPVSLVGPASTIPDRLAGWGIAAGFSMLAITFLWPSRVQTPLRPAVITALRALAARLRADGSGDKAPSSTARAAIDQQADAALAALARQFNASPYRPIGLSMASRALVRLVDELRWLGEVSGRSAPSAELAGSQIGQLNRAAATVLDRGADLLAGSSESRAPLAEAAQELRRAIDELEGEVTRRVPRAGGTLDLTELEAFQAGLEPGFREQETGMVVAQIAANIELAFACERRSWAERLAGRAPDAMDGALASVRARARAHLNWHSVWLHNSLRGGIALGLAVLFGRLLDVEHSFWVALGTLTILRSNAVSTGQNIANAMLGTVVGFLVGCSLVELIGANETVLWLLLPVAVLLAGFAPVAISFAAGQAAFTLTVLILFNIFAPAGWHIGIVRIEDVAIGAGTGLVVGLLFWPRGAGSALAAALSDAYAQTVGYLTSAVAYATSCCDGGAPRHPTPADQATRASAAARRLDDAFRSFVAEHGTKRLPLARATVLVNGPSALRLAADAILALWQGVPPARGDRAEATRELMERANAVDGWYRSLGAALHGERPVPEPALSRRSSEEGLLRTIERDLQGGEEAATAAAVRIIWTGDYLALARGLEGNIAAPAREAQPRSGAALGRAEGASSHVG